MDKFTCYHSLPAFNSRGEPVDGAPPQQRAHCKCGKNAICTLCGQGQGMSPCNCDGIILYNGEGNNVNR